MKANAARSFRSIANVVMNIIVIVDVNWQQNVGSYSFIGEEGIHWVCCCGTQMIVSCMSSSVIYPSFTC